MPIVGQEAFILYSPCNKYTSIGYRVSAHFTTCHWLSCELQERSTPYTYLPSKFWKISIKIPSSREVTRILWRRSGDGANQGWIQSIHLHWIQWENSCKWTIFNRIVNAIAPVEASVCILVGILIIRHSKHSHHRGLDHSPAKKKIARFLNQK